MFGCIAQWIDVNSERIYDIRVQVELALEKQEPSLVKRVLSEALMGGRDSFRSRCHFGVASDVVETLLPLDRAQTRRAGGRYRLVATAVLKSLHVVHRGVCSARRG